jgi:hypothetical protein
MGQLKVIIIINQKEGEKRKQTFKSIAKLTVIALWGMLACTVTILRLIELDSMILQHFKIQITPQKISMNLQLA